MSITQTHHFAPPRPPSPTLFLRTPHSLPTSPSTSTSLARKSDADPDSLVDHLVAALLPDRPHLLLARRRTHSCSYSPAPTPTPPKTASLDHRRRPAARSPSPSPAPPTGTTTPTTATDGPSLVSDTTPAPSAPSTPFLATSTSSSSRPTPSSSANAATSPAAAAPSSAFAAASTSGTVHPLTLHAIARRGSERDAVRVVEERRETERRRDEGAGARVGVAVGEGSGSGSRAWTARVMEEAAGGGAWSESPPQLSDREDGPASSHRAGAGAGLGRPPPTSTTTRPGGAAQQQQQPPPLHARGISSASSALSSDTAASGSGRRKKAGGGGGAFRRLFSSRGGARGGASEVEPVREQERAQEREREQGALSRASPRDEEHGGRTPQSGGGASGGASLHSGNAGGPARLELGGGGGEGVRETVVDKGVKISRPKVKAKGKSHKDFSHLFLAQELVISSPGSPSPSSPSSDPPVDPSSPQPEDNASQKSHAKSNSGAAGAAADEGAGAKKRRAVWAIKFSEDGKYLAVGGKDGVVRVWEVLSTPEAREAVLDPSSVPDRAFSPSPDSPSPSSARPGPTPSNGKCKKAKEAPFAMPVFASRPVHEFKGHEADVLDLSWSKNNFLLSSSMDKTVRLWHVSRDECLCAFQHLDFVTSIAFHPKDDRFFLSGSLDCKLRLWNIPEKRVHIWTELPELITAVSFTRDGKLAIAGSFVGAVMFFFVETFQYHSQVAAKTSRSKSSKGKKVTSLAPFPLPSSTGERLLVTTNDSRLRLYHTADKIVETTYAGHENASSQIRASFSDDGRWIVSGSEDRNVYIWDSGLDPRPDGGYHLRKRGKESPHEHFPMPAHIVTAAVFAPTSTRTHLTAARDPVFADGHTHMAPLSRTMSGASLGLVGTTTRNTTFSDGGLGGADVLVPVTSRDGMTAPAGGALDAILVVADDETGVISIFRNSELMRKRSSMWGRTKTVPAR
ncbi:uncharacterized protein RHOBADRAFT_55388 [Rhodotorula graminis WP1]|uniref:WD40 repeat-like protein n=1 Tax=Rhodotorula graminis (strain WP1) TaxID=578459 RepID=A0A0P9EMU1_RHOGW|nr:uncharacterized protein RHOBADRAFT_55388 [Rhodotorula graminis WP1]KPV73177.1 hypothetical protein RHOBADRAFT_55388 [Rhodotorula graminis WP1]